MAYSFSQLQDIKNRVVNELAKQQAQQSLHENGFAVVDVKLADMQNTYLGWATEVNAYLTANPSDAAAQALKAEKDALVGEFSTLRTKAQAAKAAIEAL